MSVIILLEIVYAAENCRNVFVCAAVDNVHKAADKAFFVEKPCQGVLFVDLPAPFVCGAELSVADKKTAVSAVYYGGKYQICQGKYRCQKQYKAVRLINCPKNNDQSQIGQNYQYRLLQIQQRKNCHYNQIKIKSVRKNID